MQNGSPKPISRRRFLAYSAAALAAQACASATRHAGMLPQEDAYEPQFYVASPRYYLNLDQDFSKVQYDRVLKAPGEGFPPLNRTHFTAIGSRTNRIRYVSLPGLVHSVLADRGRAIMVPTDGQRWLYSLDAATLEIAAYVKQGEDEYPFAGHAVLLGDPDLFAITQNSRKVGKYDRVSIRDRRTLKELANVSSYGFEAHDMKVSADGRHLYVGHYGSLLGSGPYEAFAKKDLKNLMTKARAYGLKSYSNIYPPSVTVVELASGKLVDRLCSVESGPHCHFVVGTKGRIYLPHMPSLLTNRKDTLTNPLFHEGEHGPENTAGFEPHMLQGFGTSIAFDEQRREVLIPSRWVETTNYFPEDSPGDFRTVNLKPALPAMEKTHGLAFHPDGKHYVITGNNWLATMERGSHKLVAERSFPVNLFLHAHTAIG